MSKYTLKKHIFKTIIHSKIRLISIMCLMLLGSFALVGLKSTKPNIENTVTKYFNDLSTTDLTIISNYGFTPQDQSDLINNKNTQVEFSYFVDTTLINSIDAIRLFSNTHNISKFYVTAGSLPQNTKEIALSSTLSNKYQVGDTISFTPSNRQQLENTIFTISGFVNSSELIASNTLGESSAGNGRLTSFAVIHPDNFLNKIPTLARIKYNDLANIKIFSDNYTQKISKYYDELVDQAQTFSQRRTNNYPITPTYQVYTRSTILGGSGYVTLQATANGIDAVGNLFPIVLYFVAILVTTSTITRFVQEERTLSGTLKALGYNHFDVIKKFIYFGLVSGLIGTVLGIILGTYFLPQIFSITLLSTLQLPKITLTPYTNICAIALISTIICSLVPTLIITLRDLNLNVAYILLPKPPKNGSKILLERLQFIWQKLSFTQKVTIRNIFRYKQRMFMTIFGVAGSIALLFAGLGILSSLNGITDRQYQEIIKYDLLMINSNHQEINTILDNYNHINSYLNIHSEKITKKIADLADAQTITLMSTEHNFNDYIQLFDYRDKQPLNLKDNKVIISEKLAKLLNIKTNQTFSIEKNHQTYNLTVSKITEMYTGHYIFLNNKTYHNIFNEQPQNNAYLIKLTNTNQIDTISNELLQLNNTQAVIQNTEFINQINAITTSLQKVMIVLISVSIILAIVILYNLNNINLNERIRELSTIKVLGFYDLEVTLYIYRETICLSFIGILIGLLLGQQLHQTIIETVATSNMMFNPKVELWVYIIPIILIILIVGILGIVIYKILRKINMLDALKSTD